MTFFSKLQSILEPGEEVYTCLKAEFIEEAVGSLIDDPAKQQVISEKLNKLFQNKKDVIILITNDYIIFLSEGFLIWPVLPFYQWIVCYNLQFSLIWDYRCNRYHFRGPLKGLIYIIYGTNLHHWRD